MRSRGPASRHEPPAVRTHVSAALVCLLNVVAAMHNESGARMDPAYAARKQEALEKLAKAREKLAKVHTNGHCIPDTNDNRRVECEGRDVKCYFKPNGDTCWPDAEKLMIVANASSEYLVGAAPLVAELGLDQWVVNFGANDGVKGDPTFPFVLAGFTTLEVEGATYYTHILRQLKAELEKHGAQIRLHPGFVLPTTLPEIMRDQGVPKNPAFFKVGEGGEHLHMRVLMNHCRITRALELNLGSIRLFGKTKDLSLTNFLSPSLDGSTSTRLTA